mgnify:CR=1 FL=1
MKYLVLILLSILLFSCSDGNKEESEMGFAKSDCLKINQNFDGILSEKCPDCNLNEHTEWFETNNYCETKYPEIRGSRLIDCLSEFTDTLTKEQIKAMVKTQIEDQTPLCRNAFARNAQKRCISMNEFIIDELKSKCATDENLATLIEQHTTFYTNNCSSYSTSDGNAVYFNKECSINIHALDCTELKQLVGTKIEDFNPHCAFGTINE